jgi:hypothetical protein
MDSDAEDVTTIMVTAFVILLAIALAVPFLAGIENLRGCSSSGSVCTRRGS